MSCPHDATVTPCPACLLEIALEPIAPGTILNDRFRIVELAGRGGMGEVYRAEDLKLAQDVALKFVRFASDDLRQRLLNEVRLGREIAHPNVCRIYDVVDVEGEDCIVMEYVDGTTLDATMPLSRERGMRVAREICAGVAASHDRDVVHGDLKPGNVMIDRDGHVRITDFGLAALSQETAKSSRIAGTPAYMAPEQLRGELLPQSDLYALALLLGDVFGDAIPKELQPVIERSLARDPRHRPQSAREILALLPVDDEMPLTRFASESRSPWRLVAAVVVCLGLVISMKPSVSIERDARLSSRDLEARARTGNPVDHASWFDGPPLVFRYRQSDRPMVSRESDARITATEPAVGTLIELTPTGAITTNGPRDREPPFAYKLYLLLIIPLLGAAALMARANLRSGRVDKAGARRIATWAAICRMIYAVLEAHHVPLLADEAQILGTGLARSALLGIEVWLGYLAVEPYIRRRRPRAIEAWTRFVHGRFGDPLVGRDVLTGALFGIAMTLVACVDRLFDPLEPFLETLRMLSSPRSTISLFFYFQTRAIFYALFAAVLLVALRSRIRPKWIGSAIWIVIATFVFTQSVITPLHIIASAVIASLLLIAIARPGMLSAAVALFFYLLLIATPLTPLPRWYAARGYAIELLLIAIIAWATAAAARRLRPAL